MLCALDLMLHKNGEKCSCRRAPTYVSYNLFQSLSIYLCDGSREIGGGVFTAVPPHVIRQITV